MSTTTWNGSSADWSDAADWSAGLPNSSSITAILHGTSAYTLTLSGGDPAYAVGAVTFNDAKATFDFAGTLDLTNLFTFTAGVINFSGALDGGKLSDTGGKINFADGAFENLTYEGALAIDGGVLFATDLTLKGAGGTGTGSADIENAGALDFAATQTLDSATVDLGTGGTSGAALNLDYYGGSDILTLGASLNVVVGIGGIAADGNSEIINTGSITFGTTTTSGGKASIGGATFVNQRSITVTDDETLNIGAGDFSNSGSIKVASGSLLDFQANLTAGLPGGISIASGGTLEIDGVVTSTGTITTTTGETLLLKGEINGGVLAPGVGTTDFDHGALANLTIEGALDLKDMVLSASDLALTGANGVGPGSVDIENLGSLDFVGTQTLDGATVDIGTGGVGGASLNLDFYGGADTLTLGSDLNVIVGIGGIAADGSSKIVNAGTITFGATTTSGGKSSIGGVSFVNQGSITVTDNETLNISAGSFANSGSIKVASGSLLDFQANLTVGLPGGIAVASGGTLEIDGVVTSSGTITTTAGELLLLKGEINGGVLAAGAGTIDFDHGALENLTFEGALDLTAMTLFAVNLTLKGTGGVGPGSVDIENAGALDFVDTQTLNGATVNIGTGGTSGGSLNLDFFGGTDTLTLGAGLDVVVGVGGIAADGSSEILNAGSITFGTTTTSGASSIGGATFVNHGSITVTDGETVVFAPGTFINSGVVTVSSGELSLLGAVGGAGSEIIGAGGTLKVQGAVAASQSIRFGADSGGEFQLDDPSGTGFTFSGAVSGFSAGDIIDLPTFAFSGNPGFNWSQSGAQGVLTVTDGADVAKITLVGHFATADFSQSIDSHGDTQVGIKNKYIDTSVYAASGYALSGKYHSVVVGTEGVIGGPGVAGAGTQSYTILNRGEIETTASKGHGVTLAAGGRVTNSAGALIEGYFGVRLSGAAGTVTNSGTLGTASSSHYGVRLDAGGVVNNYGGALIEGYFIGVDVLGAAGVITNAGTIDSTSYRTYTVVLTAGGRITNDANALIEGSGGIFFGAAEAGTVINDGDILATGGGGGFPCNGVYFGGGGGVTNGTDGYIGGHFGIEVERAAGEITNSGSIAGAVKGVYLTAGGTVTNRAGAYIAAYYGVQVTGGSGTVSNTGMITTDASSPGADKAVDLTAGGVVLNSKGGEIQGSYGVVLAGGSGTVTNFGSITSIGGAAGIAVQFGAAGDVLVVEAGASFVGQVLGDGGTLDLGSGAGTLSGLFSAGGVIVSGSMAATTFQAFDTVQVSFGASFSCAGATTIAAADKLIDDGALTLSAAVANAGTLVAADGTLTVKGAVTGAGHVDIAGGVADFGGTFSQNVFFTGTTGVLELSHAYSGKISGLSKTGTNSIDLLDIAFTGVTTAAYSGTTTSGVLTVKEGLSVATINLLGDYLGSKFILSKGPGGVGTQIVDPIQAAATTADVIGPAPPHQFVAAMAGFGATHAGPAVLAGQFGRTAPTLAIPRPQMA